MACVLPSSGSAARLRARPGGRNPKRAHPQGSRRPARRTPHLRRQRLPPLPKSRFRNACGAVFALLLRRLRFHDGRAHLLQPLFGFPSHVAGRLFGSRRCGSGIQCVGIARSLHRRSVVVWLLGLLLRLPEPVGHSPVRRGRRPRRGHAHCAGNRTGGKTARGGGRRPACRLGRGNAIGAGCSKVLCSGVLTCRFRRAAEPARLPGAGGAVAHAGPRSRNARVPANFAARGSARKRILHRASGNVAERLPRLPTHLTQVLGRGFRQGRLLHLHQPASDVGRGRAANRFARKRCHGRLRGGETRFRRLRRQVGRLHGRRLVHQLRTLGHQTRRPRGFLPMHGRVEFGEAGRQLAFAHPPRPMRVATSMSTATPAALQLAPSL